MVADVNCKLSFMSFSQIHCCGVWYHRQYRYCVIICWKKSSLTITTTSYSVRAAAKANPKIFSVQLPTTVTTNRDLNCLLKKIPYRQILKDTYIFNPVHTGFDTIQQPINSVGSKCWKRVSVIRTLSFSQVTFTYDLRSSDDSIRMTVNVMFVLGLVGKRRNKTFFFS